MQEQDSILMRVDLPTGANAEVKRSRFGEAGLNMSEDMGLASAGASEEASNESRIEQTGPRCSRVAFVAGIRGDAPQGVEVALKLMGFLREHQHLLNGVVDVYPCLNPLALEQGERRWPFFNVDLNRLFPGKKNGFPPSKLAHIVVEDLNDPDFPADLVI